MIVLQCTGLSKYYGSDQILDSINLSIREGERLALVGRNGAGKSTLLKIIAGDLSYDSGQISMPKDVKLGYLAQHTGLESSLSIWDEMLTVFEPLQNMERHIRSLEHQMSDEKILADSNRYKKLLKEYDELQIAFKDQGGYQYEADIRSILAGMHFSDFDYNQKISTLSGGQKTRLALAKLLLIKPDLLILDEPTNHLDISTLTWLESYLLNYQGAILIVSHDRYFLDKIVTKVVELSRTKATHYTGNYSTYLEEKAKRYEIELKQFERQQEHIVKVEEFIQRNIARASTTKRAQSKRRQLEKLSLLDRPADSEKSASFSFEIKRQSGREVLRVKELTVAYGDDTVLNRIDLAIDRSESVALIGPNGSGKSTLLKSLIDVVPYHKGEIRFGSNVTVGYYDQEQANLKSNKLVLHELWDEYPAEAERKIRTVLGNFLFSGEDVLKPVSTLSGGEKARLALAKLMMKNANFLILDEPTNHLDLDSKEILEAALIDYPGTILFVSHDRYFLNRMASRIIELQDGSVTTYLGNYDYYIEKKEEAEELLQLKQAKETEKVTEAVQSTKLSYELEKVAKQEERQRIRRIEEIEEMIESLEEAISEHEETLCLPEVYSDHEKAFNIQQEIDSTKNKIDSLMEEWEQLHV